MYGVFEYQDKRDIAAVHHQLIQHRFAAIQKNKGRDGHTQAMKLSRQQPRSVPNACQSLFLLVKDHDRKLREQ